MSHCHEMWSRSSVHKIQDGVESSLLVGEEPQPTKHKTDKQFAPFHDTCPTTCHYPNMFVMVDYWHQHAVASFVMRNERCSVSRKSSLAGWLTRQESRKNLASKAWP